MQLERFKLEW